MKSTSINNWLNELGARKPVPGGGAVCALNGAIAAAQLKMVCEYSKDEDVNKNAESLNQKIETFLDLAEADSKAFEKVSNAYKTKVAADIDDALTGAIQVSVDTVANCEALVLFCEKYWEKFNTRLKADLIVVIANIRASIEGCEAMENTNINSIKGHRPEGLTDHINFCEELYGRLDTLKEKIEERS